LNYRDYSDKEMEESSTSDVVCYICHEEATDDRPFLPQGEQCACRGSNVIHDACFDDVLRAGYQTCSLCRQRWAFLPSEKNRTYTLHGHSYSESWYERDGRRHGPFRCLADGRLHIDSAYKGGILDGWMRVYSLKTGLLDRVVFYEDGRKNYTGFHYSKGRLLCNTRYYKGVRHGGSLYYRKDGSYGRILTYYYGSLLRN